MLNPSNFRIVFQDSLRFAVGELVLQGFTILLPSGILPGMVWDVSVVIPVYNGAADLDQCLAMLKTSIDQPLECIVVDDGSTDNSVEIATRHNAKVMSTEGRFGP